MAQAGRTSAHGCGPGYGHASRRIRIVGAVAVALALSAALLPGRAAPAEAELLEWLPTDWVRHPVPVHIFEPEPGQEQITDRIFPTVMRVDDKIATPLDGHRWYLWVWRHGLSPRTEHNGGRLILLTADRLEGPWTDRGFVTPVNMTPAGWVPRSWTGGDVVWSDKHQKFFSVPHAGRGPGVPYGIDSFLMESSDGVNWTNSSQTPILRAGPEWYDRLETGYGRLHRVPGAAERWVWLYRSGRLGDECPENSAGIRECYTLSVARADDIRGPWTKSPVNPVFDPFAGNVVQPEGGGIIGLSALVRYAGRWQILWQGFLGDAYMSRSEFLNQWETFARYGHVVPLGEHRALPVMLSAGPSELIRVGAHLVYDDQAQAWTYLYLGWDIAQVLGQPGRVSVNIARSLTGGAPPQ